MKRRFAAPGQEVTLPADPATRFAEVVDRDDLRSGQPWDQYLADPSADRMGICCSGGGIRSASYQLGVLQVLRDGGELARAAHLASVSGGDYMTVAHAVLVSETLNHGVPPPGTEPDPRAKEAAFFDPLAPWAPRSPEEQHLRDHTTYLAPGLRGKAWMGLNLLYGVFRHMVPFGAWITLVGALFGLAFSRWIGPVLRTKPHHAGPAVRGIFIAEAWALLGLGLVVGACLLARQWMSLRSGNAVWLDRLQRAATLVLGVQALLLLFGMTLPAFLLLLHARDLLVRSVNGWLATAAVATTGSFGIAALLGYVAKRGARSGLAKKLVPRLMPLVLTILAPIVVGVPFAVVTYFVALKGTHLLWPAWLIGVPLVLIAFYWFAIDEVTSNMHLFYRERLATVFVGLRNAVEDHGRVRFGWAQPPWKDPILFSKMTRGRNGAKLPNLVVCAAINVSDDVLPPGRLAGSFTFERDYSGGPLTGYVPTALLEQAAGRGVLTLPAMMAISGAALSPSMGKMTRPWARFLLALFNARLGVWIPNPLRIAKFAQGALAVGARRVGEMPPEGSAVLTLPPKSQRPGSLYVFREALGLNDLGRDYVYVTDGGHWDNLGLVELLRRGCGVILCFDAAGDDLGHFHTLSEAIELARSDLGVEITMDLDPLRPGSEGFSERPYAEGCIRYPDGTTGLLLFAKASITKDSPQDALDWRSHDPRFPSNPTTDQWFDDRQFESYRALGAHAARSALRALKEWETDPAAKQRVLDLCEGF